MKQNKTVKANVTKKREFRPNMLTNLHSSSHSPFLKVELVSEKRINAFEG